MNIECDDAVLEELQNTFKFNDAILRSLILKTKSAVTEESSLLKSQRDEKKDDNRRDSRPNVQSTPAPTPAASDDSDDATDPAEKASEDAA